MVHQLAAPPPSRNASSSGCTLRPGPTSRWPLQTQAPTHGGAVATDGLTIPAHGWRRTRGPPEAATPRPQQIRGGGPHVRKASPAIAAAGLTHGAPVTALAWRRGQTGANLPKLRATRWPRHGGHAWQASQHPAQGPNARGTAPAPTAAVGEREQRAREPLPLQGQTMAQQPAHQALAPTQGEGPQGQVGQARWAERQVPAQQLAKAAPPVLQEPQPATSRQTKRISFETASIRPTLPTLQSLGPTGVVSDWTRAPSSRSRNAGACPMMGRGSSTGRGSPRPSTANGTTLRGTTPRAPSCCRTPPRRRSSRSKGPTHKRRGQRPNRRRATGPSFAGPASANLHNHSAVGRVHMPSAIGLATVSAVH